MTAVSNTSNNAISLRTRTRSLYEHKNEAEGFFHIKRNTIRGPARDYWITRARHKFCHDAYYDGYTQGEIATFLNRDRTAVCRAVDSHIQWLKSRYLTNDA